MVDDFISYWTEVMNKPDDPMNAIVKKMIEIPKIVFTKTIYKSRWINTDIATGDPKDEITRLKNPNGGDILVYGGVSFDSSLIKDVAIGNGDTIFKDLPDRINRF